MDLSKSAAGSWAAELLDNPARKAKLRLGVFAVVAIGSAMLVGYEAGETPSLETVAKRAWHGKVARVARAGAEKTGGVMVRTRGVESAAIEGTEVGEGTDLWTDARTRVRIELDDGTSMVLDRGTFISVEAGPRTMRLKEGSIVADVAHVEGAPNAHLVTPTGEVGVLGTKFALTSTDDRTTVEVMRGVVDLKDASSSSVQVAAGQEGVASRNAKLEIAPVNDLAQRLAFGEGVGLPGMHNEDAEAQVSGLGELRAKRPGKTDEKDHVVALTTHNIKVRIVGNVARTEVDETFSNETGDDLEGLYRFPLPPDAQIERLALEVDGKLVDGSFVDKAKGAAIFRGAVHNATPDAPKPKEEIIWVPG
ncbi:MAG: VIT domain-containing protein, partial [Polyangiaceae bacterium]